MDAATLRLVRGQITEYRYRLAALEDLLAAAGIDPETGGPGGSDGGSEGGEEEEEDEGEPAPRREGPRPGKAQTPRVATAALRERVATLLAEAGPLGLLEIARRLAVGRCQAQRALADPRFGRTDPANRKSPYRLVASPAATD